MTLHVTPEGYVDAALEQGVDWRDELRRYHGAVEQLLRCLGRGEGGYAAQYTLRSAAECIALLLEKTEDD